MGARAARRRGRTGIAMSKGWWRGLGASAAARRLHYRSDRRELVMGTRCTQAAGVRAGRVIKGRADTGSSLPRATSAEARDSPPPGPGHSLSRWAAPGQSTPLPRPLPSRRKLRDPERGDSTVIQQCRRAPSCPFGAGGSRYCGDPGSRADPWMTSLGGLLGKKESHLKGPKLKVKGALLFLCFRCTLNPSQRMHQSSWRTPGSRGQFQSPA